MQTIMVPDTWEQPYTHTHAQYYTLASTCKLGYAIHIHIYSTKG